MGCAASHDDDEAGIFEESYVEPVTRRPEEPQFTSAPFVDSGPVGAQPWTNQGRSNFDSHTTKVHIRKISLTRRSTPSKIAPGVSAPAQGQQQPAADAAGRRNKLKMVARKLLGPGDRKMAGIVEAFSSRQERSAFWSSRGISSRRSNPASQPASGRPESGRGMSHREVGRSERGRSERELDEPLTEEASFKTFETSSGRQGSDAETWEVCCGREMR